MSKLLLIVQVRVARWYECVLGRRGHKHLCVSKAMQRFLRDQWHISAVVLYDTPPAWFQRASNEQAHDLLVRLAPTLIHLTLTLPAQNQQQQQVLQPERRQQQQLVHQQRTPVLEPAQQQVQQGVQQQQQAMADAAAGHRPKPPVPWLKGGNPFTEVVKGRGQWRANRPALIVSSTSWTADEDFGILLEAGILYDKEVTPRQHCAAAQTCELLLHAGDASASVTLSCENVLYATLTYALQHLP